MNKSFWVKHRDWRIGSHFVACGQLSRHTASQHATRTVNGVNRMERYATREEYEARLSELAEAGEHVRRL